MLNAHYFGRYVQFLGSALSSQVVTRMPTPSFTVNLCFTALFASALLSRELMRLSVPVEKRLRDEDFQQTDEILTPRAKHLKRAHHVGPEWSEG